MINLHIGNIESTVSVEELIDILTKDRESKSKKADNNHKIINFCDILKNHDQSI